MPQDIPMSLIEGINIEVVNEAKEHSEDEASGEEKEKEDSSLEINFSDFSVKDILHKDDSKTFEYILTDKQELIVVPNEYSKCYCGKTNKKFKNCCLGKEFRGEYDKEKKVFYCDMENLKKKYHLTEKKNEKNEVFNLSKQMDKIFI